jgi:acetyltransferase-like isoleucine patch superfamily enzyme
VNIGTFLVYKWRGNSQQIKGSANKIELGQSLLKNTDIKINGSNNLIVIGKSTSLKNCRISVKGHHHRLQIADNVSLYGCEFIFEDDHCLITIGSRTKILKASYIAVAEPHSAIEIGEDCLISTHFHVRNSDSHSILDKHTGLRINPAKNVKIQDHVWIGGHVQILKGVTVMRDSIIGMGSLVTKDVPENSLVAGVPAQVIKTNVDWCEARLYS